MTGKRPTLGVIVGNRSFFPAELAKSGREEILCSLPGELRIYTTPIPATDRRVCLMQDRIYRADTTMNSMGYTVVPMTSCCLEAHWPGLNLAARLQEDGTLGARVVVSAPLNQALSGTLSLVCPGSAVTPNSFDIGLEPGERSVLAASVTGAPGGSATTTITAQFDGKLATAPSPPEGTPLPPDRSADKPVAGGPVRLRASVPVKLPTPKLSGVPMVEAEEFTAQDGGKVHVRTDKVGTSAKAISHWDDQGHWLEWQIQVPESGTYKLVLRYCSPRTVRRIVSVDDRPLGQHSLTNTGGFGSAATDWEHATITKDARGQPLSLEAGTHRIRLENCDGKGCNLDYLALVPLSNSE